MSSSISLYLMMFLEGYMTLHCHSNVEAEARRGLSSLDSPWVLAYFYSLYFSPEICTTVT